MLESQNLVQWFGNYHVIFLHFPIALLLMAGLSEILYLATKNPNFQFTTKFLLIAGALFCIPTVFSGLAFEEGGDFSQEDSDIFWWHRFFGFTTLVLSFLTILAAYFEYRFWYYIFFIFLFLNVILTGHFGGLLVFGDLALLPPKY